MGGVSVEGGGGGKKSVNSEVNMVPMIDLLLCTISFLLITAVWSQMARINADAQVPGPPRTDQQIDKVEPEPQLHVTLGPTQEGGKKRSFSLVWKAGGSQKRSRRSTRPPAATHASATASRSGSVFVGRRRIRPSISPRPSPSLRSDGPSHSPTSSEAPARQLANVA